MTNGRPLAPGPDPPPEEGLGNARNGQPWRFTVVRERELIDRLSTEAKAYRLATWPAGNSDEERRARMADPANHLLHHAPALILISAVEPSTWAVEDCSLAAQNLMLAAWSLGLGSCWIGNVQSYLNTPDGKRLLGLPEGCIPVAPVVVGYPASQPVPVPRDEPVVRWVGSGAIPGAATTPAVVVASLSPGRVGVRPSKPC